jgi:dihydroflavonol-4-reductase
MRALVTGAGGFVGRHVASRLVEAGADVVAFDRRFVPDQATAALGDVAELVEGDVLDAASVRRAIHGCDAVFHLAAVYSYARCDAALMQSVNVGGTRTVLEAAAHGRRRRVVHTSTCASCGPVPGRAAHEGDLPRAGQLTIPYRRTKLDGERLALAAARAGVDVVVVNPTAPVGPGDLRPTRSLTCRPGTEPS